MNKKQMLIGLLTFIPGINRVRSKAIGVIRSARYHYSVWMRHLVNASKYGLNENPHVIAEIGPGTSFGTGFAGILSGAGKYYALDVVEHINTARNKKIFDELVALFEKRENIPDQVEFPKMKPVLDSYDFPHDILTKKRLRFALDTSRLDKIRNEISQGTGKNAIVTYCVPWYRNTCVGNNSIDMIFSQAVLEHVDDLHQVYQLMNKWLKPGGFISHQIDFKSHGTAKEWNGHWKYSDLAWRCVRGKRPYLINREPLSFHLRIIQNQGLYVRFKQLERTQSDIAIGQLAPRFRNISNHDLTTSSAFIQACKTVSAS